MAGGKGKSIGGKGGGAKDSGSKTQKSHSAKAGLQVRYPLPRFSGVIQALRDSMLSLIGSGMCGSRCFAVGATSTPWQLAAKLHHHYHSRDE